MFTRLVLCVVVCAPAARGQDVSIDEIILRQVEHFESILSIGFTYEQANKVGEGEKPPVPSITHDYTRVNRVLIQGDLWLSETGVAGSTPSFLPRRTESYDGERHYVYNADLRYLYLPSKYDGPPYLVKPPTLVPYEQFAIGAYGHEYLKNPEPWREFFKDAAILEERETVNGFECVVTEKIGPSTIVADEYYSLTYFAPEAGYTVVRADTGWLVGDGDRQRRNVVDVLKVERISSATGDVYLPIEVSQTLWNLDGTISYEQSYTIDTETLRLNEAIDLEEFRVSPLIARMFYDEKDPYGGFNFADPKTMLRNIIMSPSAEASGENDLDDHEEIAPIASDIRSSAAEVLAEKRLYPVWVPYIGVALLMSALVAGGLHLKQFRRKS